MAVGEYSCFFFLPSRKEHDFSVSLRPPYQQLYISGGQNLALKFRSITVLVAISLLESICLVRSRDGCSSFWMQKLLKIVNEVLLTFSAIILLDPCEKTRCWMAWISHVSRGEENYMWNFRIGKHCERCNIVPYLLFRNEIHH
jgi:hypothetical protein